MSLLADRGISPCSLYQPQNPEYELKGALVEKYHSKKVRVQAGTDFVVLI